MPWILYPETRRVTEAWVISRAHDAMVNAALEEAVRANGGPLPDDAVWPTVETPSYEDAREYLADVGLVTFRKEDA